MRKVLYIVGLTTMILFNATAVSASNDIYYTNRENIEMTEEEYHNLENLGFTEMQIYRMDEQTFLDNKDIEATLVSDEKKIIKTTTVIRNGITTSYNTILSEDELQQENLVHFQQPGYGTNSYGNFYDGMSYDSVKEIDVRIAILDDNYARFKIDTYWDYIPSYRYHDIAGIYFDGSKLQISSIIMHRQDYVTLLGSFGYSEECYVKEDNNSGSVVFELPSGSLNSLESYMYFNVHKRSTAGTITTMTATGDYAHAHSSSATQSVLNNFTMHSYGIDLAYEYAGYYDNIPETSAVFVGQW